MNFTELYLSTTSLHALFIATFLGSSFLPAAGLPILTLCIFSRDDLITIFMIATAGNWLGAVLSYALGAMFPVKLIMKIFRVNETKLNRANQWFEKYNFYTAIGSGIPILGDRVSIVLGIFRTPFLYTISLMLFGKALRFAILIPVIKMATRSNL
jgi:membrane protein YqaA with SNARE-associated domain